MLKGENGLPTLTKNRKFLWILEVFALPLVDWRLNLFLRFSAFSVIADYTCSLLGRGEKFSFFLASPEERKNATEPCPSSDKRKLVGVNLGWALYAVCRGFSHHFPVFAVSHAKGSHTELLML